MNRAKTYLLELADRLEDAGDSLRTAVEEERWADARKIGREVLGMARTVRERAGRLAGEA